MTCGAARFQVLEGHAIALKVWMGDDSSLYADVMRRKSTFGGIDPELVDLSRRVAAIHGTSVRFLIPCEDASLSQDVQRCGMRHIGYLEVGREGARGGCKTFHLWDATATGRVLETKDLVEPNGLDFRKVVRQVFALEEPLSHRLDADWIEHLQELRMRERYFLGATRLGNSGGAVVPTLHPSSGKPAEEQSVGESSAAVPSTFKEVLASRRSAPHFHSSRKIERAHVTSLLSHVFWRRHDGSSPFPSAGGFAESYVMHMVVCGVEGLEDGVHQSRPGSPSLDLVETGPMHEVVAAAFFRQAGKYESLVWFLVVADPSHAMSKYGPRGYRFLCLDAGGLLSLMSLAAAAAGHPFRIYGGFDDELVASVLGLEGQRFVVCGAAMGAPP